MTMVLTTTASSSSTNKSTAMKTMSSEQSEYSPHFVVVCMQTEWGDDFEDMCTSTIYMRLFCYAKCSRIILQCSHRVNSLLFIYFICFLASRLQSAFKSSRSFDERIRKNEKWGKKTRRKIGGGSLLLMLLVLVNFQVHTGNGRYTFLVRRINKMIFPSWVSEISGSISRRY